MFRRVAVFALAVAVASALSAAAQEKKQPPAKGEGIAGSVADEGLEKKAPEGGVIATKARLDQLLKDWDVKEKFEVDFDKELVVVATTRGSRLNLRPLVKDGDLKVLAIATRDLRPGFRYAIQKVSREGVKTVDGKPLPKE